jgi:YVTN family beta-propeller protein
MPKNLLLIVLLSIPLFAKPYAYVAITNNDVTGNVVQVIDTATNQVMATITVGTGPFSLKVTPDGSRVYVANYATNNVSVINTASNTVTATIPVGGSPASVAISPNGQYVYVGNYNGQSVSVVKVSSNSVVATIPVDSPEQIVVSPDGTRVCDGPVPDRESSWRWGHRH